MALEVLVVLEVPEGPEVFMILNSGIIPKRRRQLSPPLGRAKFFYSKKLSNFRNKQDSIGIYMNLYDSE